MALFKRKFEALTREEKENFPRNAYERALEFFHLAVAKQVIVTPNASPADGTNRASGTK